jgi:1-acyl-sn-glycerol-3-phosphate acyltransferase
VGTPFSLPPLKGTDREAELKKDTDEIMCRIAAMLPPEKRGFYADHPRTKELIAAGYPDFVVPEPIVSTLPDR